MTLLSLVSPVLMSVLVGYFVGSVSFPRLAVSLASNKRNHAIHSDTSTIRTKFGADRASIVLGTKYGIAMGILDMLKVAVPMAYFRYVLYPNELFHLIVSIAGLVGHNWPIYYRFKGGRGFSVMLSSFIIIDWMGTAIIVFSALLLGMVVVKNLMLAYVSWLWLMIPWLFLRTLNYNYVLYTLGLISVFMITTVHEIQAFIRLNRDGNRAGFLAQGLYESSPRWRMMKRMQDRLDTLGPWRFAIVAIYSIILTLILTELPPL